MREEWGVPSLYLHAAGKQGTESKAVCFGRAVMIPGMVGKDEIRSVPPGAIGIYSYCTKLEVGLQQLMAG